MFKQKWLLEWLSNLDRKQMFMGFWIIMGILFLFIFFKERRKLEKRNFRE